jgi:hypothetical protein
MSRAVDEHVDVVEAVAEHCDTDHDGKRAESEDDDHAGDVVGRAVTTQSERESWRHDDPVQDQAAEEPLQLLAHVSACQREALADRQDAKRKARQEERDGPDAGQLERRRQPRLAGGIRDRRQVRERSRTEAKISDREKTTRCEQEQPCSRPARDDPAVGEGEDDQAGEESEEDPQRAVRPCRETRCRESGRAEESVDRVSDRQEFEARVERHCPQGPADHVLRAARRHQAADQPQQEHHREVRDRLLRSRADRDRSARAGRQEQ